MLIFAFLLQQTTESLQQRLLLMLLVLFNTQFTLHLSPSWCLGTDVMYLVPSFMNWLVQLCTSNSVIFVKQQKVENYQYVHVTCGFVSCRDQTVLFYRIGNNQKVQKLLSIMLQCSRLHFTGHCCLFTITTAGANRVQNAVNCETLEDTIQKGVSRRHWEIESYRFISRGSCQSFTWFHWEE